MTVLSVTPTLQQLNVVVASRNAVKINAVAAALRQALPGLPHRVTGSDSQSGVADQPFGGEETLQGAYNRVESIRLPHHRGCLLVAIEGGVGYVPAAAAARGAAAVEAAAAAKPSAAALRGQGQQQPGVQEAAAASQKQDRKRQQAMERQGQQENMPPKKQRQHQHPPSQQQQPGRQQQPGQQQPEQQHPCPQLECFAWVVVQAPSGATTHARSASFPLPPAVSELMLKEGLELGQADDAVFGRVKSGQGSGTIGQLTGGLITRQTYYEHATLCALVPLLNPHLYPGFSLQPADA